MTMHEIQKTAPLASWNGETYGNRIVEGMWQAWQASRATVVVELPAEWRTNVGKMLPTTAVRDSIEAQGLKCEVKP